MSGSILLFKFTDEHWTTIVGGNKVAVRGKSGQRIANWLEAITKILEEPSTASVIAKPVASFLSTNFTKEGAFMGRRWQGLSEMTQNVREQRGFDRQHPILMQTGELRELVVGGFDRVASSKGMNYVKKGDGAIVTISVSPNRVHASISGPKVENQYGGFVESGMSERQEFGAGPDGEKVKRYGAGTLPRRPFFYVTEEMIQLATHVLINKAYMEWANVDVGKGTKPPKLDNPAYPGPISYPNQARKGRGRSRWRK